MVYSVSNHSSTMYLYMPCTYRTYFLYIGNLGGTHLNYRVGTKRISTIESTGKGFYRYAHYKIESSIANHLMAAGLRHPRYLFC